MLSNTWGIVDSVRLWGSLTQQRDLDWVEGTLGVVGKGISLGTEGLRIGIIRDFMEVWMNLSIFPD